MMKNSNFERYERQIILPKWGVETQEKLKRSRVLIAGMGGLGCPVALNLAQAGVGHLRICDYDQVETTNLNRQFLHSEKKIGMNKAQSAAGALSTLNPGITVEPVFEEITDQNVEDIVGESEIIVDCVDNFPTRYALNRCAIRKGIPMVHGAIWGMEGRVTFINPPATPCLMCIFPKAPTKQRFPALGALTCLIGSLQALEAIKYLTGVGSLLSGRMLILDASTMQYQELEVLKNPKCPACGGKRFEDPI